jgi:hypothetical protein
MGTIDYAKILSDLESAVVGSVKDDAQQFIDENKDAKAFLEAQAKDLAELGVQYLKAATDAEREAAQLEMKIVQQSIRNELAGIAVTAEAEARTAFGKALLAAAGVVMKVLPVILSAI